MWQGTSDDDQPMQEAEDEGLEQALEDSMPDEAADIEIAWDELDGSEFSGPEPSEEADPHGEPACDAVCDGEYGQGQAEQAVALGVAEEGQACTGSGMGAEPSNASLAVKAAEVVEVSDTETAAPDTGKHARLRALKQQLQELR